MTGSADNTICERLGTLVSDMSSSPLDDEITSEVALCLLDFLASTLAAPLTPAVSETTALFGTGGARILHNSTPASAAGATIAHGYLSTVEDIDDAHSLASGMHLSATVFPVSLALAQETPVTRSAFVRAIVAGYEVAGRLGRSMDHGLRARGFHATGAIGPFAAAAAAGVLLNLDRNQLANAFGMAASAAGGLFAFLTTGADSRHMHAANAGIAGLMAATAAKNGNTGPMTAFEGPDGYIGAYSGACDYKMIFKPEPNGNAGYEIQNAYHKRFNACGHAIPAITLALQLQQDGVLPIEKVRSVEVLGYPASARLTKFPVKTVSEAKFSLPVIFSLAYLHGDVSSDEMSMTCIEQPDVQMLASKVVVSEDSEHTRVFPGVRCGSIIVTLNDGTSQRIETSTPIGMKGNRLSFEEIAQKFQNYALPVLGQFRCDQINSVARDLSDSDAAFALTW